MCLIGGTDPFEVLLRTTAYRIVHCGFESGVVNPARDFDANLVLPSNVALEISVKPCRSDALNGDPVRLFDLGGRHDAVAEDEVLQIGWCSSRDCSGGLQHAVVGGTVITSDSDQVCQCKQAPQARITLDLGISTCPRKPKWHEALWSLVPRPSMGALPHGADNPRLLRLAVAIPRLSLNRSIRCQRAGGSLTARARAPAREWCTVSGFTSAGEVRVGFGPGWAWFGRSSFGSGGVSPGRVVGLG